MNWKLIDEKKLHECKVFDVYEERFELSPDSTITRFTARHPGAAVFLPVTDKNTVLLVRQYRAPLRQYLLEAPAGTLEQGEAPLDCAKREIQEEVGFKAADWRDLGILYPAPGFCDEKQHLFVARDLERSVLAADEDEDIEVVELPFNDFEAQVCNGAIVDAKTVVLYARVRALLSCRES